MTSYRSFLIALALAMASPLTASGEARDLDLAKNGPGSTRSFTVKPGTPLGLTVVNRLPGKVYTINAEINFVPTAAFTLDGFRTGDPSIPKLASETRGAGCLAALTELAEASEEKEIPGIFAARPGCKGELLEQSTEPLGSFELTAGEVLTVEIEREGKTWQWSFTTGARGEWRTTYGFTFVPNEDRKYGTRVAMQAGKFEIFEQKDREEFDFVPSVLFSWLPAKQRGNDWVHGWTAGLGWDLEKPVLLAGYSWMYNENLNFTLGVALHQQTRLLGKYDEGSVVGEALEPAQLVETTYGPNVYIGVGFRFDRANDPFARGATLRQKTAEAETARLKSAAAAAETKKKADEIQKACEARATSQRAEADRKCLEEFEAPDKAAQRAACSQAAEKAEAADKAACPETAAKAMAAERKREECRNAALSSYAVEKDLCAQTLSGAKAECAKKGDSEREACLKDAAAASEKCLNKATQVRDAALVQCND